MPRAYCHLHARKTKTRSRHSCCTPSVRTSIPFKGTSITWSHVLGGTHPLCSRPSRHLLPRAAHPEGTSSFCLFWCFLFHTVHTLVNIFSSGYFIPLCLCDLSIHCIRIHSLSAFAITQCSSCLSWGAYRESLGPHFSFYK